MIQTPSGRRDAVLASAVEAYVASARPVGSQGLASSLGVSPATVRGVFADLEREGLLTHPHTSAGRVPTDRGYRRYVNRLMRARELSLRERREVEAAYRRTRDEVEHLVKVTAHVLSVMTRLAGVAVVPVLRDFLLDGFRLVHVAPRRVLVVLVLRDGLVREEVVRLESDVSSRDLERVTQMLNNRFAGYSLETIRARLIEEAEHLKRERLALAQAALDSINRALALTGERIRLEGGRFLVDQPEFRASGRAAHVVRLLEEPRPLARVLERRWGQPGLAVEIGGELPDPCLREFSFVHQSYRVGGRVAGFLGVLGPTRMAYGRVAGLVQHLARALEEALGEEEHHERH